MSETLRGTTICAVKRGDVCAVAGDGQVTLGEKIVMKRTAVKVRRIYGGRVVIGFAGSVSDAFALSEKFEAKLEQYGGNLPRAAVELAQDWHNGQMGRNLEAMMITADANDLLVVSGNGEVITPDDGVVAIGSGGSYAYAAARALVENTELDAPTIAEKALRIAGSICVFTNDHITVEVVGEEKKAPEGRGRT